MKYINRFGRLLLLAACVLGFAVTANAQVNSNTLSVPVNFTMNESITLSTVSGSPQTFPPNVGGAATQPLVVNAAWNFSQARHLTWLAYFMNPLTGTNASNIIPMNAVSESSSADAGDTFNGNVCGYSGSAYTSRYAAIVLPPGFSGNGGCSPVFDGSEASGTGSLTSTITLTLVVPSGAVPDSYSTVLFLAASAL